MNRTANDTRNFVAIALGGVLLPAVSAHALESVQQAIATPAYEQSVRTIEILKKCDTNGDGEVSMEEGEAHFREVFAALDVNHDGELDSSEWAGATQNDDMVSLSTGGYARALSSMTLMVQCDVNNDRKIDEREFLTMHQNLFNKMAAGQPTIDAEHWIAAHIPIKD
jgi:hypothetical protein